jgi:hypothetical protein
MAKNQFVVKYNEATDLYLTVYNPDYNLCQWGAVGMALTFSTLEQAQAIALGINSGTVGTTKP